MSECYFSIKIKRLYIQLTKSMQFLILFDRSGGAKTLLNLNMSFCNKIKIRSIMRYSHMENKYRLFRIVFNKSKYETPFVSIGLTPKIYSFKKYDLDEFRLTILGITFHYRKY